MKDSPQSLAVLVNYYLFSINFCRAWICLLIDAINATIDFKTSAFETTVDDDLTGSVPILASCGVTVVKSALNA